ATGPEHAYALARHYSLGDQSRSPKRVHEVNVLAARAAAENFAFQEAHSFLSAALAAFPNPASDSGLEKFAGEVCARTGRMADALSHFDRALELAKDPVERSDIRAQVSLVRMANADPEKAWSDLVLAFKELGTRPPQNSTGAMLSTLLGFGYARFL